MVGKFLPQILPVLDLLNQHPHVTTEVLIFLAVHRNSDNRAMERQWHFSEDFEEPRIEELNRILQNNEFG